MRIQLDMFAVELGSAILLQFETGHGVVRVLADAGEARHKVNDRLPSAIKNFGQDELRIDLLVGTHYDADHLDGLVAIIENQNITIGEAWLPPVSNDTQPHSLEQVPGDENLLPLQLMGEDSRQILRSYIMQKADLCARLASAERQGDESRGIRREDFHQEAAFDVKEISSNHDSDLEHERISALFRAHVSDAEKTIGLARTVHGDEQAQDPWNVQELTEFGGQNWYWDSMDIEALSRSWHHGRVSRTSVEASALAMIRRSTAHDALNANSLAAVVNALRVRKVGIRCSTIANGKPRRFYWKSGTKRFSPIRATGDDGPELLLLGPSDGLVKKYWDRLPIGTYTHMIAKLALPIEPISASNQLSYIMTFEYESQRILVSGDAGCVDFSPGRNKPYYSDLIDALEPLHVVQVAHHAGHNAHFYNCLLASKYPMQKEISYLLLSHKTDDKNRPSDLFTKFITSMHRDSDDVKLLFTSHPLETKVRDIKALIEKVVGGPPGSKGDIRLDFDSGKWTVSKHVVNVH